jgi:sugar lactone lactonase YvrE
VAAPKRLDDKTIEAIVPNGASNGDVLVTLAGTNGNPVPFKVIKSMSISPKPSKLVLNNSQAFTVTALDTDGKPIDQPAVTWTVVGATFKDGKLTADKVGPVKLTVGSGSVSDTLSLDVAASVPAVSTLAPNEHFQEPIAVAGDVDGNIFFCDNAAQSIQRISADGKVTTIAGGHPGYADGPGASAAFANPNGIAIGSDGTMYVTEWEGCRVRKITKDGVVSTLAGSKNWPDDHHGYQDGAEARFDNPKGIAVDSAGNVYVADFSNHVVRQITPGGLTSTYAGTGTAGDVDGAADSAQFTNPCGLAMGPDGTLVVTDAGTGKIKKITRDRKVSTIASGLVKPEGISRGSGNVYYVAEAGKNRVVMVNTDGTITLLAGGGEAAFADGLEADAAFDEPNDVALINDSFLAVADRLNHKVRKLSF